MCYIKRFLDNTDYLYYERAQVVHFVSVLGPSAIDMEKSENTYKNIYNTFLHTEGWKPCRGSVGGASPYFGGTPKYGEAPPTEPLQARVQIRSEEQLA